MRPPCNVEDLEALVRGELPPTRTVEVTAHAASCPECKGELLWLRTEADLVTRRAQAQQALSPMIWEAVERAIEMPLLMPRRLPRHVLTRSLSWGLAAAALALAVVGTYGVTHITGLKQGLHNALPGLRFNIQFDDDAPPVATSIPVKGPLLFRLETLAADVHLMPGQADRVQVRVSESGARQVRLLPRDDNRMEVEFDGEPRLSRGRIEVELPPGSGVDLTSTSGDVTLGGPLGKVNLHTTSGEVKLAGAASLEAHSTSGDVSVNNVPGDVEVATLSGEIEVNEPKGLLAPRRSLTTASGDVSWKGACASGCQMHALTASGDIHLALDPGSSFALTYASASGELHDTLGMTLRTPDQAHTEATYGDGRGSITCASASGDLRVGPR